MQMICGRSCSFFQDIHGMGNVCDIRALVRHSAPDCIVGFTKLQDKHDGVDYEQEICHENEDNKRVEKVHKTSG